MKFSKFELSELSQIEHEFSLAEYDDYFPILVCAFKGEARSSQQESPFRHMKGIVAAGRVAAQAEAVILDLTQLTYDWGDEMAGLLNYCTWHPIEFDLKIPFAVVMSDRCREGLTSLVRDEMQSDPKDWLYDSMDEATDFVITSLT